MTDKERLLGQEIGRMGKRIQKQREAIRALMSEFDSMGGPAVRNLAELLKRENMTIVRRVVNLEGENRSLKDQNQKLIARLGGIHPVQPLIENLQRWGETRIYKDDTSMSYTIEGNAPDPTGPFIRRDDILSALKTVK